MELFIVVIFCCLWFINYILLLVVHELVFIIVANDVVEDVIKSSQIIFIAIQIYLDKYRLVI